MDDRCKELAQKHMAQTEDIIRTNLPDGVCFFTDLKRITRLHSLTDKTDTYCLDGKPFLLLHPVTFETVYEKDRIRIVASQKYRKIEAAKALLGRDDV